MVHQALPPHAEQQSPVAVLREQLSLPEAAQQRDEHRPGDG